MKQFNNFSSWYLRLSVIAVITLVMTASLAYVYYLYWLAPATAATQFMIELEPLIVEDYFVLWRHRLAVAELAGLDPQSGDFYREREGVIAVLAASRDDILAKLREDVPVLTYYNPGERDKLLRRMKDDVLDPYLLVRESQKTVLSGQEEATENVSRIEKITREMSAYQPEYDLGELEASTQAQQIIGRLSRTRKALLEMSSELNNVSVQTPELKELVRLSENIAHEADEAEKMNDEGAIDASLLRAMRDVFIGKIHNELKPAILAANVAPLKQGEVVGLLAKETELIGQYQYLLQKLDEMQAEVYREKY
jgi:hypothetical protein